MMNSKGQIINKMGRFVKGQVSYWKGKHPSLESRKKMSLANKGKIISAYTRQRLSETHRGRPKSTEHKFKISMAKMGVKRSPETIEKMRIANTGRKLSPECRAKISISLIGNKRRMGIPHPPEIREKISIGHKGQKAWNKGIPQTIETRQKISQANRGERSPFWKGGISFEPYSKGWSHFFRQKIRERDNQQCQICFQSAKDLDRKLCVHHIDYNKQNLDPLKLITLCHKCHTKTNYNREYWQKRLNDIMEQRFVSEMHNASFNVLYVNDVPYNLNDNSSRIFEEGGLYVDKIK